MNIETVFFNTTNLALAAYLVAGKHLNLERVDVSDPSHAEFVFADPNNRGQQLEAAFLTTDAPVPAASFHRQLRVLRHLIDEKTRATRHSDDRVETLRGDKGYKDERRNSSPRKYSISNR